MKDLEIVVNGEVNPEVAMLASQYEFVLVDAIRNHDVKSFKATLRAIKGVALYYFVRATILMKYNPARFEHLFLDFERNEAYLDILENNMYSQ